MQSHSTWANWFVNHTINDTGNGNLQAFSDILGNDVSNEAKLRDLVEEIDTVILAFLPQEFWRNKVPPRK